MVVDLGKLAVPATRATVAARTLELSVTRQAAARQALPGDGDDEMIWAGWRRNPNRGPRHLPPYFPSDVS